MGTQRPNPETLLREIREDSPRRGGKLKIFFGYAAGVGKTYAMLEAAHEAKAAGVDVVAGYIEPHTRPETLAKLEGLETLPPLELSYKSISLREFDLDGALRRAPRLILVDELAHTNGAGCRHQKRYQDIQELLRAGIDVYTTVNVQHIESLNDIVAAITGVTVRERVPDRVFDEADQVELVDIEPEDLIARLNKGKIYREGQARRALDHFFTRENLVALREIALRRTADRLNRSKEEFLRPEGSYYTEEHILICLSASPSNGKVIRTAARMAEAFHGRFTALYVETPSAPDLKGESLQRLRENLHLAEQLGARIATVYGDDVPVQIAEYAKLSGVSKLVVGRSNNRRRFLLQRQTLVEQLTELAPNIDIYIIPDRLVPYSPRREHGGENLKFSLLDALKALGILALCTLAGYLFFLLDFSEANIITIYILGVLFIALVTRGRIYSGVTSILSVLVFNFCFTDPYFTFRFHNAGYWMTFFIMFLSAFITSTLTMRVKNQAKQAAQKSYRTEVLLETSQELQRSGSRQEIYTRGAQQIVKLLDRSVLLYPAEDGHLESPLFLPSGTDARRETYTGPDEQAVAQWVFLNNKRAGATTTTLPGAKCLYMAVRSAQEVLAVVGVAIPGESRHLDSFDRNILVAILSELALALEKERSDLSKKRAEVRAQQEQLRANLLRAISHDLRTPLTSISGNAGVLMENSSVLDEEKKHRLYVDIYDDSMWLASLVENLLSVTRIENGTMELRMEPELVEEVVQEALRHVNRRSREHRIVVSQEDDMLMARMDSQLVIQVLINLVDNAIKYTRPGSTIQVSAKRAGRLVQVSVADDGDGVSDEAKKRLFDMFYTVDNSRGDGRRGLGLGLSLCRSIVQAHGGTIEVRDNVPHGTVFTFTLPVEEVNYHE